MESNADDEVYIARIAAPEIVSALYRKMRAGEISHQEAVDSTESFKADLDQQYQIIGITNELTDLAVSLIIKHPLRGYDSVQLAAAIELRNSQVSMGAPPLTFVSADSGLNRAAQLEGLIVANPNDHR